MTCALDYCAAGDWHPARDTEATYNRKTLLAAVRAVSKAVDSRVLQPILACVKISDSAISGTNLDLTITLELRGERAVSLPDVITPVKPLIAKLSALTAKDVTLAYKLTSEGPRVTLNGLVLETFDAADYPTTARVVADTVHMGAASLARALDQTLWAAADYDYSHSILGGLSVRGRDVCATDGSRMSYTMLDAEANDLDLIIPVNMLEAIRPLLKTADVIGFRANFNKVEAVKNGAAHLLEITGEHFTATMRLIAGQYPRYAELFPVDVNAGFTIQGRGQWLDALKVLKAGLNKDTNMLDVDLVYDYPADDEEAVTHSGQGIARLSNGTDTLSVPAWIIGKVAGFRVNFHYLQDVLEAMDIADIPVRMAGPLKPLVFTDGHFKHLLMPIQRQADKKGGR